MGIYFAFIKKIEPRRLQEPVEIAGDEYTPTGKKTNYFAIMSSGFIINTLNPAVISFWVIMAASLASVYSFYDRIIIFSTCLGVNMLADIGKGIGSRLYREKTKRPGNPDHQQGIGSFIPGFWFCYFSGHHLYIDKRLTVKISSSGFSLFILSHEIISTNPAFYFNSFIFPICRFYST